MCIRTLHALVRGICYAVLVPGHNLVADAVLIGDGLVFFGGGAVHD